MAASRPSLLSQENGEPDYVTPILVVRLPETSALFRYTTLFLSGDAARFRAAGGSAENVPPPGDERWDGRVAGLVVTDVTEKSVQLRALVSAADSGKAWDLRCHVREKLVEFVREHYPESLPRLRAERPPQVSDSSRRWGSGF